MSIVCVSKEDIASSVPLATQTNGSFTHMSAVSLLHKLMQNIFAIIDIMLFHTVGGGSFRDAKLYLMVSDFRGWKRKDFHREMGRILVLWI